MKIILASKSPRRKELLEKIGYDFETYALDIDEDITSYNSHLDYVKKIVTKKANYAKTIFPNELVICADTVVVCNDKILGKPKTKDEAFEMIKSLSGKVHLVVTGTAISYQNDLNLFLETTEVEVIDLSFDEINEYINTNEPYDKAGGYAIQGIFGKYIKKINGDYYNVVGLPISRLYVELKKVIKK